MRAEKKDPTKRLVTKLRYGKPRNDDQAHSVDRFFAKHLDSLNSDVVAEVLAHITHRILRPPFFWSRTADLLGLLAHLERLRVSTVDQADLALQAISLYRNNTSQRVRIPPDKEVAHLEAMADKNTARMRRREYHQITIQIRWMHLARILISRDLSLFDNLLPEYFPPPTDNEGWKTRPYLDYLSPEEVEGEILQGKKLVELRSDSEEWRTRREIWWRNQWPNMPDDILYGDAEFCSYEQEFFREFPPVAELGDLVGLTDRWVEVVKLQTEILEEIFTLPEKRKGVLLIVEKQRQLASRDDTTPSAITARSSMQSERSSPVTKEEPSSPSVP
ncbi:hypothetical protein FRB94_003635 [Tulasnella sp. JGI-2019a]|nr:hypothetical protein FRB94_003635 [Tulasnella sp. JGI-2019a]